MIAKFINNIHKIIKTSKNNFIYFLLKEQDPYNPYSDRNTLQDFCFPDEVLEELLDLGTKNFINHETFCIKDKQKEIYTFQKQTKKNSRIIKIKVSINERGITIYSFHYIQDSKIRRITSC